MWQLAATIAAGCPEQDAKEMVERWPAMVVLLAHTEDQVRAAALAADPQRAADVLHGMLAAAASLGGPAERSPVLIIADFACAVVTLLGSSIPQQAMERILSIRGLPGFLADCVAYYLKPVEKSMAHVTLMSHCLWMLKLVLEEAPASKLQPLTPQQLERMQLLRMFKQHPLHGSTPREIWTVSSLHPAGLDIIFKMAQLRNDRQLLQHYWAEGGVHHLQVRCLACAAAACPTRCLEHIHGQGQLV